MLKLLESTRPVGKKRCPAVLKPGVVEKKTVPSAIDGKLQAAAELDDGRQRARRGELHRQLVEIADLTQVGGVVAGVLLQPPEIGRASRRARTCASALGGR